MNLNLLRIFHMAAKTGSFTRAATELHLTQPGISKHIKELERCWETRLFDRVGKKVLLTQAGEILYRTTGDIFNALTEAQARIHDLRGLASGKLSIGSSITIGSYILPELLVEFRENYPDVELKLDITLSRQTVEKVLDYSVEIGFVGHYEYKKSLVITPFMTDALLLIVSATHEWGERTRPVPLQKLVDYPFLLSRLGSGTRIAVDNLLKSAGVRLGTTMELGTTEGVKHAVAAGLGVSILSEHMVRKEVASGAIRTIPLEGIDLKRHLYLVRHKDRYLSEAAQAFLKQLKIRK
jgi:DNA-binding transcriptional LysR family regulator